MWWPVYTPTMVRAKTRRQPRNKFQRQRRDPLQLPLDSWLESIREDRNALDDDLPTLLSAATDPDTNISSSQDASPGQDSTREILLDPNQASPDIAYDVSLQTEVVNADGTVSAVTQPISNDQVAQAQKVISNAIKKSKDEQEAAICDAI